MRQRFAIVLTIAIVLLILVALNTASYVSSDRPPDTEFEPDRSTYNVGATGTKAFYDLLEESGHRVIRWREKPDALLDATGTNGPSTFVVVGKTRAPYESDEIDALLKWVARGGQLVLVDRRPDARFLRPSETWQVSTSGQKLPVGPLNPESVDEMTAGMPRVHPSLPSVFTRDVESIAPSVFAGAITISSVDISNPPPAVGESEDESGVEEESPPVKNGPDSTAPTYSDSAVWLGSPAPVAHFEDYRGALMVDYGYGSGRIVVVSDPFFIANNGVKQADNLQLGINAVTAGGGLIAFDEYHQGRGVTRNQLVAYFAGTPIMWMLAQAALIVLVVLWTRGRRFARPLPVARVDRRSSLEFVSSMAELQLRARAYDLALENIYTRLRRVLVRYGGLGHNSTRSEIAARVALRSEKLNATRLENLMRECEDAINGSPLDDKKTLSLVKQLRMVEKVLGLRVRSREARQTAEGLQQGTL